MSPEEVVLKSTALSELLHLFELDGHAATSDGSELVFGSRRIPIRNGIPRFSPDLSYSTGNFSRLRERHAQLQLDSANGTHDRRDTLLGRTSWPREFFAGKLVLECGCGAGPDTEIMRGFGARVLSVDLAGVDIAQQNVGHVGRGQFVQADITQLPLRPGSFDIVFCHRVLQHTPNPAGTLDHILRFVKPEGAVFVHSYARTFHQMFRWKYALLPLTRRMSSERLYRMIEGAAPSLYALSSALFKVRGGSRFAHHFVPFINYSRTPKFANLSRATLIEYGIHDTFDALSPRYDSPLGAEAMRRIAQRHLQRPFEIYEHPSITLLRTVVS